MILTSRGILAAIKSSIIYLLLLKTSSKWLRACSASKTLDKVRKYSFFTSSFLTLGICLSEYSSCFRWAMSSTIRLSVVDFWTFPDMTKFFNKANIVFGFDRKSGLHTLMYCIPPPHYHTLNPNQPRSSSVTVESKSIW